MLATPAGAGTSSFALATWPRSRRPWSRCRSGTRDTRSRRASRSLARRPVAWPSWIKTNVKCLLPYFKLMVQFNQPVYCIISAFFTNEPLLCATVMRHCYAPLLCAIVTWKVEQPPLLCAIVMRHLLCCVVLGLVCYLSPWMQRQPARGPGLCSEPADPRDARLGQALVEVLCAICCVAFARHCCVAFGGISPFGDFQCPDSPTPRYLEKHVQARNLLPRSLRR